MVANINVYYRYHGVRRLKWKNKKKYIDFDGLFRAGKKTSLISNTRFGVPKWLSFEVIARRKYDLFKTEAWGIGVVFYEALFSISP
jgi:hypothetical protein